MEEREFFDEKPEQRTHTPVSYTHLLPWVLAVLAAMWVASLVLWAVTRNFDPALLMSLINYAVSFRLYRRVSASADGVDVYKRQR